MENFNVFISNLLAGVPTIVAALLILLVGWLVARGLRSLFKGLLGKINFGKRVDSQRKTSLTNSLGNILYYIIMVMVILAALERLGISQVLQPLGNMLDKFLSVIPNIVAAGLIAYIGYLLAKFVSTLIKIGGDWLDKFVEKSGIKDTDKLIKVIRNIVFLVIFIPILIQAFNVLNFEAISDSANLVLSGFIDVLGKVILAVVVLLIFVFGGKFIVNIVKDILKGIGLDKVASKLDLQKMLGEKQTLSGVVSNIVFFFIVFFGVITASEIVGLENLTGVLQNLLEVSGQILFGLFILLVGNYISKLLYNAVERSDNNKFVANVVRYVTLALFLAISLRTMGIANSIIDLGFGLTMGAVAVAIALSYGLGGREAAGESFREILNKFKSKKTSPTHDDNQPSTMIENNENN